MKLYVHYEDRAVGASTPPRLWTKRITLTSALKTIDDVLRIFCAAHARKFQKSDGDGDETATLTPVDLNIFTERNQESSTRRRFEHDRRAQRWVKAHWCRATDDPDDGGDDDECDFELVVVRRPVNDKVTQPSAGAVSLTNTSSIYGTNPTPDFIKPDQAKTGNAKLERKNEALLRPSPPQQQQLKSFVELGLSQMQQLKYRSAKQIFETLVLSVDPCNAQALVAMGDIHFANQRFDIAVNDSYKKCWVVHSGKPYPDREQAKIVFECGLKIVRCEIQRKKYRGALTMIDKLQHLLRHEAKAFKSGGVLVTAEKEEMEAKMDLLKAQTLYEMHATSPEQQEPAIALLVHLLPDLQDPHVNLDALLLYAKIAFERGKKSEALTMVLRVLVARPDDKLVKKQLASFLTGSSEMKLLQQVLPPEGGASAAAAYAFIGTILKDFGALESSVTCFERAQIGNPACPSYALNHAHVLEVCNLYESAYSVLTTFFRKSPTLSVGEILTAGAILDTFDAEGCLPATDQSLEKLHGDKAMHKREEWRVEWVLKDTGHARVYLNDTLVGAPTEDQRRSTQLPEQDQLDLLACFFTVVKVRSPHFFALSMTSNQLSFLYLPGCLFQNLHRSCF